MSVALEGLRLGREREGPSQPLCLATDSALPLKPDTSSRAFYRGLNRVDRYGLGFG